MDVVRTTRTSTGARAPRHASRLLPALALLGLLWPGSGHAQGDNLLNRIGNERMQGFEDKLTQRINSELARYLARGQYVLSVKVIWNQDVIPVTQDQALAPDKQKLPGFPIFVRAPDTPAVDEATPPYTRLNVKVLLDETLPEYYERFVRKLIPLVARFDPVRGDQVVVVKETFPVLAKEQPPPTLPENELMTQLGEQQAAVPQPPFGAVPGAVAGYPQTAQGQPLAQAPQLAQSPRDAAQTAFDEGRYQDALRAVQAGFQRATNNQDRALYLSMEGSILYTMNNRERAKASWERALTFDPSNVEVNRMLNHLEGQGKEKP